MAAGGLAALVCLVVLVGRLDSGTPTGVGTVVYGLALASAGLSVELARRARTRWAMGAVMLGVACGVLGEGAR